MFLGDSCRSDSLLCLNRQWSFFLFLTKDCLNQVADGTVCRFPGQSCLYKIQLDQAVMQGLKASKERCPNRKHRQSVGGEFWISPGEVAYGCREVEFGRSALKQFSQTFLKSTQKCDIEHWFLSYFDTFCTKSKVKSFKLQSLTAQ